MKFQKFCMNLCIKSNSVYVQNLKMKASACSLNTLENLWETIAKYMNDFLEVI